MGVAHQNHTATMPTVTPVGTTAWHVLLAPEAHAAAATGTCRDLDFDAINETGHGSSFVARATPSVRSLANRTVVARRKWIVHCNLGALSQGTHEDLEAFFEFFHRQRERQPNAIGVVESGSRDDRNMMLAQQMLCE